MAKIQNVGKKLQLSSKIEIYVKNWDYGQKSNFWWEIKHSGNIKRKLSFVLNTFICRIEPDSPFTPRPCKVDGQKSKVWSKVEIMVKNRNFGQKVKLWSKIEISVKYWNYGPK